MVEIMANIATNKEHLYDLYFRSSEEHLYMYVLYFRSSEEYEITRIGSGSVEAKFYPLFIQKEF